MIVSTPHHEKDYRSLALFAPEFLRGTQLLVMRISQADRVECDVVRGEGAPTSFVGVVILRSHMRLLDLSAKQYHSLFDWWEQAGRLVREVEAQGWAPILDRTDVLENSSHQDLPPVRNVINYRHHVGLACLRAKVPGIQLFLRLLQSRLCTGSVCRMGWVVLRHGAAGFSRSLPVEYFEDPLIQSLNAASVRTNWGAPCSSSYVCLVLAGFCGALFVGSSVPLPSLSEGQH